MKDYLRTFMLLCGVVCLFSGCASARTAAEREPTGELQQPVFPANITPVEDSFVYLPLVMRADSVPLIGGCGVFPADNIWNTPVDTFAS